jgi:hypothetical protein
MRNELLSRESKFISTKNILVVSKEEGQECGREQANNQG